MRRRKEDLHLFLSDPSNVANVDNLLVLDPGHLRAERQIHISQPP